jgi:hypothetical protein
MISAGKDRSSEIGVIPSTACVTERTDNFFLCLEDISEVDVMEGDPNKNLQWNPNV